jgi:hypothetical protein
LHSSAPAFFYSFFTFFLLKLSLGECKRKVFFFSSSLF